MAAAFFGGFLGLTLLKFGNPPIMEKYVAAPKDAFEFVLGFPWPISWAYTLLAILAVAALLSARHGTYRPGWILWLPIPWLVWQVAATFGTLDHNLSNPTLKHFFAGAVCFYVGLLYLSRLDRPGVFLGGLLAGFLLVLAVGWEQHFGGLEQSRQYFYLYVYPQVKEVPPEYLKRLSSTRVFSTLFYPNVLAGALLLLSPALLFLVWKAGGNGRMTMPARVFLVAIVAVGVGGCLFWSGSKGGWLLMLLLGLIVLFSFPLPGRIKVAVGTTLLLVGLSGFFLRYAGFFQKGATSVSARLDYWHAAAVTAKQHPWLGTGPGTFAIPYQELKKPESEMARLVHNDYLQQASDSGLPGALAYLFLIGTAVTKGYTRFGPGRQAGKAPLTFESCIWLGVLGWCLQGFAEFGLYIPALAWPAFTFLGWMVAPASKAIDKPDTAR